MFFLGRRLIRIHHHLPLIPQVHGLHILELLTPLRNVRHIKLVAGQKILRAQMNDHRSAWIIRRYLHLGTGNYNPITARLYTDIGMFTCNEEIGADVSDLFNHLTGYSAKKSYRKLLVAPHSLRSPARRGHLRPMMQHRPIHHPAHHSTHKNSPPKRALEILTG